MPENEKNLQNVENFDWIKDELNTLFKKIKDKPNTGEKKSWKPVNINIPKEKFGKLVDKPNKNKNPENRDALKKLSEKLIEDWRKRLQERSTGGLNKTVGNKPMKEKSPIAKNIEKKFNGKVNIKSWKSVDKPNNNLWGKSQFAKSIEKKFGVKLNEIPWKKKNINIPEEKTKGQDKEKWEWKNKNVPPMIIQTL